MDGIDEQLNKDLKKYIEDNMNLINNNDYQKLYDGWWTRYYSSYARSRLTQLLFDCKIDFMRYLDEIPHDFAFHCTLPPILEIPLNITYIGRRAFYDVRGVDAIVMPYDIKLAEDAFDSAAGWLQSQPDRMRHVWGRWRISD